MGLSRPSLLAVLLTLSVLVDPGEASAACRDWDTTRGAGVGVVRVYQGEVGRLACPIFQNLRLSNYSLLWYRVQPGQDLGQPMNVSRPGHRISAEGEWLWFLPAVTADAGRYICALRNGTQSVAMGLEVLPRPSEVCVTEAAADPVRRKASIDEGLTVHCPDVQEYQLPKRISVAWFGPKCKTSWTHERVVKNNNFVIHKMIEHYEGNYTCVVTYQSGGRTLNFTRVVTLKAVSSSRLGKTPIIHNPDPKEIYTVKLGSVARLDCSALVYHADFSPQVWWEIDGRRLELLSDQRITNEASCEEDLLEDRTMKSVLVIQKFSSQDFRREYTCYALNSKGNASQRAVLKLEPYVYSVELGCVLGAVFLLTLIAFTVYHVFRLELLLLYRAYCGPYESDTDGKEYDVYISYARNSEEEQFVLMTLRRVLENELGYKVFIFDRDSLPGGTITDETLSCVGRSRCLMVVLSPRYVLQGTQALLELKAGLDTMAQAGHLRIILVQYQPMARSSWVRELRRARVALTLVQWKGEKSSHLSSRFWKQLQVELPVRRRKPALTEDCSAIPLTALTHTDSTHTYTEYTHTDNTHTYTDSTHTHTDNTPTLTAPTH
ncbi:interleukin-1 receptor accessory protein isoform X2 [Conger conger]|uniref:interleukin-1 receptor accessory protein isoform X2 n=1 Tax=Conger conger TaxID=82655 RepID=UPI002A5A548B|nr:interleukin-1 receptor accessory protein isoform X2 [Conger conger]